MILASDSLIIPAPADLIWGTVSFIIIAVAMYKLAWPTFMRVLDERTAKIDEGLNSAARAQEEVAKEREALASEVDDARREAAQIREKAQANATDIVSAAQKQATLEAHRIAEASARQIQADAQSAQQVLRSDVGSLASDLAAKIVGGQALDPTISQGVIDRFLDELETVDSESGKGSKEG
ncbi:F0F1 ATP synthase subunit B [Changpingibacter yushuensis]|uniref:F0F1 ATP synthase subunit B n=1 Tax=Changpingibacter yushuensis TaxID=2758440 RepID=UPI0015F65FA9|nr:F0F1 ATP synthase subunit B [Changpingibacter yushuensis]